MSLVIGIILGSFIAMILIVIIVLKVRTGVELDNIKQLQVFFVEIYLLNIVQLWYSVIFIIMWHIVNIRHIEYRPRRVLELIHSKK